MEKILQLEEIKQLLPRIDLIEIIERGFVAYSQGRVVVPPVGEMLFEAPPGEVHIKYGYLKNDDFYIIKVASGFYQNPQQGLPSSSGLMLVFCQKTGLLKGILLDNGHLTDVRTAAAGAVAAKHLASANPTCVGILGAGTQARLQLAQLCAVRPVREALIWTPDKTEIDNYRFFFRNKPPRLRFTDEVAAIPAECDLIITTTPAQTPLIRADQIRPGTHITAVGSDTPNKIELDPQILAKADTVVVDSISQSQTRGEVYRAVQAGEIERTAVMELGNVIESPTAIRQNSQQITVADLTGVAVQDIQIARAVYLLSDEDSDE